MRKAPKYGNRKVEWNGEKFDSQAECSRYSTLLIQQRLGLITGLTRQVSFVLAPKVVINGAAKRSLIYRADFGYTNAAGQQVVEDVKGALTAVYKIKRHLMMSVHGISILETR